MILGEREHPKNYNSGIREMMEENEDLDEDIVEINWEDIEQEEGEDDAQPMSDGEPSGDEGDDQSHVHDDARLVLSAHTGSVFCCSLHPSDNYLITGGEDDKAMLWNLTDNNPVQVLSHYQDSVCEVSFSFDGQYVCIGDMMGNIEVYGVGPDFCLTKVWSERIEEVQWVEWHKQGHVLLVAGLGTNVYMWKIPSGECKVFSGEASSPCGTFMPDGKRALVAYRNGSVRVFNLVSCDSVCSFKQKDWNLEEIISMTVHSNNNLAVVGDTTGNMALFTTHPPAKIIKEFKFSEGNEAGCCIENLMFTRDSDVSSLLVSTSNSLYIWDYIKQCVKRQVRIDGGVTKMIAVGNSDMVAMGTADGCVHIVDVRQGTVTNTLTGHSDTILSLVITRDLKSIITTSDDTTIRLFSLTQGMDTS